MNLEGSRIALINSDVCNPPTFMHLRIFGKFFVFTIKINFFYRMWQKLFGKRIKGLSKLTNKNDWLSLEQRYKMVKLATKKSKWIRPDCCVLRNKDNEQLSKFVSDLMGYFQSYFDNEFGVDYERVFFVKNSINGLNITSNDVRDAIKKDETIRYCTENDVVDYIEKYKLYTYSHNEHKFGTELELNSALSPIKRSRDPVGSLMSQSFSNAEPCSPTNINLFAEPIWKEKLFLSRHKATSLENIIRNNTSTPVYDNLTFEDMLKANEHWVNEMIKQTNGLRELKNDKSNGRTSLNKKVSFLSDDNSSKINATETVTKDKLLNSLLSIYDKKNEKSSTTVNSLMFPAIKIKNKYLTKVVDPDNTSDISVVFETDQNNYNKCCTLNTLESTV
uniref:CTP_transf_like domain-containing protein n=1 Tax=Rhabditophanes sp. KR3021 TaxID=114890 RepID=A0AC35U5L2_9BILA